MKTHVKYGLIAGAILILWTMVGYLMGNEQQENLKWLGYIISYGVMIYCFVFSVKEIKTTNGGYIAFGKAFGLQMKVALILTAVYTFFSFFYFKFINPSFVDFIRDKQIEEMQKKGLSDDQIASAEKMMSMMMSPGMMVIWMVVGFLFMSLIFALIIAAIMKKENPEGPLANTLYEDKSNSN
jgi:hypothetical protein